jgi:hypothetical protein
MFSCIWLLQQLLSRNVTLLLDVVQLTFFMLLSLLLLLLLPPTCSSAETVSATLSPGGRKWCLRQQTSRLISSGRSLTGSELAAHCCS